jgi:hypothetical protein
MIIRQKRTHEESCCRDLKYLRELIQLRMRVLIGDREESRTDLPPHTMVRLEVLRSVLQELDTLAERRR